MNIGKYIIDRMNDSKWIIYWTDEVSRYRNQIIIDDLESILDNVFRTPHDTKKMELVVLFKLAMTNPDKFFEHPMSHDIIKHLPNTTQFPGNLKTSVQRFHWHLTQFIEAYSSMTGCRFSPTELEPQLLDMRDSF